MLIYYLNSVRIDIDYYIVVQSYGNVTKQHVHYISLTTFFAENKDKFSSTVFDISVNVCHQTYEFVPQSTAHFWSVLHITQWGQYLTQTDAHTVV